MTGSAQSVFHAQSQNGVFARNSRISWIGSKIMQSTGVEPSRMDAVHQAMMLRILQGSGDVPPPAKDEGDQLAAQVVAVARVAEEAAATGGSRAAMAAIMRESGKSIDPLLAQNFLRLASSPIFWMALDSANETRPTKPA